jgi:hypothetical protein
MSESRLTYNGRPIRERGEMLSLTDMWRAAGGSDSQRPSKWLEIDGTDVFVNHISSLLNVPVGDIIQSERGRNGGTWAHWQIGMAYAKYLSPEFHAWCNQVVRDHMEHRHIPVETLPAIVASEPRAFEVAIERLATFMQSGFEMYGRELGEVKQDVRAIHHRMTGVEMRVEEIARRGRRRIKDSVKGEITRHTGLLGGRCPCCGVRTVVADGRPAPHAEFDHFYANSAADAEHVWLICVECHADLTRHVAKRDERNAEFQAFQSKRRRLPGAQMQLIEAA